MNPHFLIDKITNSIESVKDGTIFQTEVLPLLPTELKEVTKKKGWKFRWQKEFLHKNRRVYKLVTSNNPAIHGLISLEIMDNYIEMHLIETAPHNYGKAKQFYGVAGNLVAFACKCSFEKGFEGYVSFLSKTRLIQHYIDTLGAQVTLKDRMAITTISARKLVNSYYKDFPI